MGKKSKFVFSGSHEQLGKIQNNSNCLTRGPLCSLYVVCTDYGRPMKPFFIKIPNVCLGGRILVDIKGEFSRTKWMNSRGQKCPNIHLGFEFEFGPQRIWDLAIVCQ